jgi:hypothetical protein
VLTDDAAAAHILVVEDDAALREVVAGALNSAGYSTSIATHGITASQMLRNAEGIDIVLLDIGLPPRADGEDTRTGGLRRHDTEVQEHVGGCAGRRQPDQHHREQRRRDQGDRDPDGLNPVDGRAMHATRGQALAR